MPAFLRKGGGKRTRASPILRKEHSPRGGICAPLTTTPGGTARVGLLPEDSQPLSLLSAGRQRLHRGCSLKPINLTKKGGLTYYIPGCEQWGVWKPPRREFRGIERGRCSHSRIISSAASHRWRFCSVLFETESGFIDRAGLELITQADLKLTAILLQQTLKY